MKVTITPIINRLTAPAQALAADYKHRGLNRTEAWDRFIIDRSLRPNLDAKHFFRLFDEAAPRPLGSPVELEVEFAPSHRDTLLNQLCQITYNDGGWWDIVWASGRTGGHPTLTPEGKPLDGLPDRYTPLEGDP